MNRNSEDSMGLDPAVDPHRWNSVVDRITTAADSELARRRNPFAQLRRWGRPILAAAASIAALAAGALLSQARDSTEAPRLADAVLPTEVVTWMDSGEAPDVEDLFVSFAADGGAP